MKLGVFDSGIGGEAVAAELQIAFQAATITTVNDRKNIPYGEKTAEQIVEFTDAAIQPLLLAHCDVIILACNTATALAIEPLRARYPEQKFIGIEPMVKVAARITKTGIIAVCATPATLASGRYNKLLRTHTTNITVIEPNCSKWAYLIENNQINRSHVAQVIDDICMGGADVIVLGCTHYHWIKDLIMDITDGRARVIEPTDAIARRVKQLLLM